MKKMNLKHVMPAGILLIGLVGLSVSAPALAADTGLQWKQINNYSGTTLIVKDVKHPQGISIGSNSHQLKWNTGDGEIVHVYDQMNKKQEGSGWTVNYFTFNQAPNLTCKAQLGTDYKAWKRVVITNMKGGESTTWCVSDENNGITLEVDSLDETPKLWNGNTEAKQVK